ncbi:MAG: hypothetical protein ACLQDY_27650 [Streptosporangiaceae bacterium]
MVLVLVVMGATVLSVPILAAVLVAVASRREDRAWSLSGPARGPLRAAARRIVGFHSEGIEWLQEVHGIPSQQAAAPLAAHRVIVMSERSDAAIAAPDQPRAPTLFEPHGPRDSHGCGQCRSACATSSPDEDLSRAFEDDPPDHMPRTEGPICTPRPA